MSNVCSIFFSHFVHHYIESLMQNILYFYSIITIQCSSFITFHFYFVLQKYFFFVLLIHAEDEKVTFVFVQASIARGYLFQTLRIRALNMLTLIARLQQINERYFEWIKSKINERIDFSVEAVKTKTISRMINIPKIYFILIIFWEYVSSKWNKCAAAWSFQII